MITTIKGKQGSGKTTLMVGAMCHHVKHDGYSFADCVGNVYCPEFIEYGYVHLTNKDLREYVGRIAREGIRHKVILVDEVGRVFPARWYGDRDQQEALIGLFQDEKLFHLVYATAHAGTGYDKLMRDARQRTVIPAYDKARPDEVPYTVICDLNKTITEGVMRNARWIQSMYNRWEFVA